MTLYPLKFHSILKERLWGGSKLDSVMGKQLPDGRPIGESWKISAVEGDVSVVDGGALNGMSLGEVVERFGVDVVGQKVYHDFGSNFPILVKLIDSADKLSVQVHPDDELAGKRYGTTGKTEMWYVVECDPGAYIYVGFKDGVTREDYLRAVESGKLEPILNKINVEPGDAWYIPAGTIHAIGEGLLVAEIQQTSDVTYRVHDWGRVDGRGKARALHIDAALDAIDFTQKSDLDITIEPRCAEAVKMIKCPYFTANLLAVCKGARRDYGELDSFVIFLCTEGGVDVDTNIGRVSVRKGEAVLLPAVVDRAVFSGDAVLIEVYVE